MRRSNVFAGGLPLTVLSPSQSAIGPAEQLIFHFSKALFALRPGRFICRKRVMLRFSRCLPSAPTAGNTMYQSVLPLMDGPPRNQITHGR